MIPASQLIFFALGVIYLFFSVSIFFRKKVKAFYFFAILMFIVGYSTSTSFLTFPSISKDFIFLFETKSPLQFLYGPAYYFFLLYLVNPNRPFSWKDLLHVLPAIFCIINLIPLYTLNNEEKLNAIINDTSNQYYFPINYLTLNYIKLFLASVYTVVGFIKFRIFFKQSGLHLFKQNKAIINWLIIDFLLRGISIYFIYIALKNVSQIVNSYSSLLMSIDSLMNVLFILLYPATLKGIRFKIAHSSIHYSSDHVREMNKTFIKNAELTDSETDLLLRLNDVMQLEHLFIDEDLDIKTVAKRLRCDSDELNAAISKAYDKNFDGYLKSIRIDFVQDRIQNEDEWKKLSLETIAARSGFKTRIDLENALKIKN